jgi:hypothetical protein
MPVPVLRGELFTRYRLDRDMGLPPGRKTTPGGPQDTDLSRFFG